LPGFIGLRYLFLGLVYLLLQFQQVLDGLLLLLLIDPGRPRSKRGFLLGQLLGGQIALSRALALLGRLFQVFLGQAWGLDGIKLLALDLGLAGGNLQAVLGGADLLVEGGTLFQGGRRPFRARQGRDRRQLLLAGVVAQL